MRPKRNAAPKAMLIDIEENSADGDDFEEEEMLWFLLTKIHIFS